MSGKSNTKPKKEGQKQKPLKQKSRQVVRIIQEVLAMEEESAQEAGQLGYICRAMTLASIPHSKTDEKTFIRRNGNFSLALVSHPDTGLPYGSIPRCVLIWVSTEATRTKNPNIELGSTLTEFMRNLSMVPTGGRWGTIGRLREQIDRLFSCAIMCRHDGKTNGSFNITNMTFPIADSYQLWWDPKKPDQDSLWTSSVTLGHQFYKEITDHPVPIDLRAVKALRKSPMGLDIYFSLTHRYSYLRKQTLIPWESLQAQFGAGYPETPRGKRNFKSKFNDQVKKVLMVYPDAKLEAKKAGLVLLPSPTHVRRIQS